VNETRDPIIERRERIRRFVTVAQRFGYSAMGLAIVAFAIGAATAFPGWSVAVTIAGLAVSIVVLPVPIVLGYGVRAAEREERTRRQ
jgi:hypothetical protein